MFEDDRPIKPDPKYIEKAEEQYLKNIKKQQDYLKKGNDTVLPCFKKIDQKPKPKKLSSQPSKAQVYEKIKKINRAKFGQWDSNKNEAFTDKQKQKKILPGQMTVSYKPKKVKISTEEYKKPGYIAGPKKIAQDPEKIEYGKMLSYLKSCYSQLQNQKKEFEEKKQYLKFKKRIEGQQSLSIAIAPKVDFQLKNVKKKMDVTQNKENKQNRQSQMNFDEIYGSECINQFRYTIDQLGQCNPFNLRQIVKFISLQDLQYNNNSQFIKALELLQNHRTQALVQNIGEKRVSKFPEGWFQSWVPGKYRTVFNQNSKYKVTWYGNGDVRQDFQGKVTTYYCKNNKVNEITVKGKGSFFYFPEILQLEMHSNQGKQIRFSDGRFELIEN